MSDLIPSGTASDSQREVTRLNGVNRHEGARRRGRVFDEVGARDGAPWALTIASTTRRTRVCWTWQSEIGLWVFILGET